MSKEISSKNGLKRKRVGVACSNCQHSHLSCDNGTPPCLLPPSPPCCPIILTRIPATKNEIFFYFLFVREVSPQPNPSRPAHTTPQRPGHLASRHDHRRAADAQSLAAVAFRKRNRSLPSPPTPAAALPNQLCPRSTILGTRNKKEKLSPPALATRTSLLMSSPARPFLLPSCAVSTYPRFLRARSSAL